MSNQSWKSDFLNCLELGTTNTSLANSFNQIVDWMRGGRDDDLSYLEFEGRYSVEWVSLRYEEFLDRLFISETAAVPLFPPSMNGDEAKKRYRQLIRIFHPDRGVHEEVWLNYRAERINKAFKKYEQKSGAHVAEIEPSSVMSAGVVNRSKTSNAEFRINTKIKYKPNFLRERLGNAREVQHRIVVAVVCCAVLLVLLVYASSRDVMPRISEKNTELVVVESANKSESEQSVNIVVNNPKAQKILDEAEWLSVSSRGSQTEISLGEISDDINASNDTVNFSNFDTQSPKLVGESHRMDVNVVDFVSGESGSNTSVPKGLKSRTFKSKQALIKQASVDQNSETKSKAQKSGRLPSSNEGGTTQSIAKSSLLICDSHVDKSMPMPDRENVRVIADLNVRSGPSKMCMALNGLHKDAVVVVRKRMTVEGLVWALVGWRDKQGVEKEGWVAGRFLNPLKSVAKSVSGSGTNGDRRSRTQKQQVTEVSAKNHSAITRRIEQKNGLKDQAVAVINQLDSAYEQGDAESLAALYISSGRENNIKGLTSIAKIYSKLFKKTHSRTVDYNISSYTQTPDEGALLRGTMMSTAMIISSGSTHRVAATVEFRLVRVGGGYKIESFKWKSI